VEENRNRLVLPQTCHQVAIKERNARVNKSKQNRFPSTSFPVTTPPGYKLVGEGALLQAEYLTWFFCVGKCPRHEESKKLELSTMLREQRTAEEKAV
jgi:hypothetical protein